MSGKKLHVLIAVLAGAGVFAGAHQLQIVLAAAGFLENVTLLGAALLGVLSATTIFLLLRHLESRRELLQRRTYDAVSADLNHHIRNALQLILNQAEMMEVHRFSEFQSIREAVSRIDWALREILPRGYEGPKQTPPTYGNLALKHSHKPVPHSRPVPIKLARAVPDGEKKPPEPDPGLLRTAGQNGKVCPWPRNEKI